MNRKELVLTGSVLLAVLALSLSTLYPAMSASQRRYPKKTVPGHGSIKSINTGVYSDQACTNPVSSINWGILDPGSMTNNTVYVRNEGSTAANMSMTLSNWNPTNASNYITLSWDYAGQTLEVSQIAQVKLTLTIQENIQGITDFSFDMTITAN